MENNIIYYGRGKYKKYKILKYCPVCNKEYDIHWKVISHIRKNKDNNHQNFLKQQEQEVFNQFINNTGRVEELFDILYKLNNIFCGISYVRIDEILEKFINREELKKIKISRISSVMKTLIKTEEHNKHVSEAVKKAWREGKFNTEEYLKAREIGYKNRRSYKGANNPMFGKTFREGFGRGRGGFRKDLGFYVRSSWEANMCRIFNYMNREFQFEPIRFEITINKEKYTYLPDFYFPDKNFYYEVKGHAKSSKEWICNCKSCIKDKIKIKETIKQHGIKIFLVGRYEYNRFKKRFKKLIFAWENDR